MPMLLMIIVNESPMGNAQSAVASSVDSAVKLTGPLVMS